MYKVFIQKKSLTFIHLKKSSKKTGIFLSENVVIQKKDLILNNLKNENHTLSYFIFSENPLRTFEEFFKNFKFIEAAGGIVKTKEKYLFIKRNGFWDLPKGKVDEGEKIKRAAVREIHEECGILCKKTNKKIIDTYHVYEFKGKEVLKKTHWFELLYNGNKNVKPQLEEGITKVSWLNKYDLEKVRKNTYPSIIDVLIKYFKDYFE